MEQEYEMTPCALCAAPAQTLIDFGPQPICNRFPTARGAAEEGPPQRLRRGLIDHPVDGAEEGAPQKAGQREMNRRRHLIGEDAA